MKFQDYYTLFAIAVAEEFLFRYVPAMLFLHYIHIFWLFAFISIGIYSISHLIMFSYDMVIVTAIIGSLFMFIWYVMPSFFIAFLITIVLHYVFILINVKYPFFKMKKKE